MSDDLISRQAAIDALYDWSEHSMTDAEAWHIRQVIGDIKSMPSAQSEIVRCENCGWWQKEWPADDMGRHYCTMVDDRTDREFYCANAERR